MPLSQERPMTAAERTEDERAIKFAEDMKPGRQPTVKTPYHLLPENQPCPLPLPENFEIDFDNDYYLDLCVQSNAQKCSIDVAWMAMWQLFSPISYGGKQKWHDRNAEVRERTKLDWERVCKAFGVLSDPVLKLQYDMVRDSSSEESSTRSIKISRGFEQQMLEWETGRNSWVKANLSQDNLGKMIMFDPGKFTQNTEPSKGTGDGNRSDFEITASIKFGEIVKSQKLGKRQSTAFRALDEETLKSGDGMDISPNSKDVLLKPKERTNEDMWEFMERLENVTRKLQVLNEKRKASLKVSKPLQKALHKRKQNGGPNGEIYLETKRRYLLDEELRRGLELEREVLIVELRAVKNTRPKVKEVLYQDDGDVQMEGT